MVKDLVPFSLLIFFKLEHSILKLVPVDDEISAFQESLSMPLQRLFKNAVLLVLK